MPKLALETIDVSAKYYASLVQLLHCVHRPRSAGERLGVNRDRNGFDYPYGSIDIVRASDATEPKGEERLESVVRLLGFVGPRRHPAYDVATDGIAAGWVSGDDEPPVEGLMDGRVSSFSGATPEGDVDSAALHRTQEMPDRWEETRFRERRKRGAAVRVAAIVVRNVV